jgi:diguanylate cyclase (GGDEF)-like protein
MGTQGSTDPYVVHDPKNTATFVGLIWLLFGTAIVAVLPAIVAGDVPLMAAGAALGLTSMLGGVALLRGYTPGYGTMLAASYAGVVALAVLQGFYGHDRGEMISNLFLPIALVTGAVHPPRRTAGVLVAIVIALGAHEAGGGWSALNLGDLAIHSVIFVLVALISSSLTTQLREQRAHARAEEAHAQELASTDPLTGLGNRRRLLVELDEAVAEGRPIVLALFDLDGFKAYNDSFGHPAGDALLHSMGADLAAVLDGRATAYRMGGDEFCVLAPADGLEDAVVADAACALNKQGEGFVIGSSFGFILVPSEARTTEEALRGADRRMYANKASGRTSAGRQTTDVLLGVLRECNPDLGEHVEGVTALCTVVAEALEVGDEDIGVLLQAASLHDIGKAAIPDAIISKAGPLDEDEWAFMRQHTVMGERIMAYAPSLTRAAQLVRSSHERVDGGGYPDGLIGDDIPLGARIICACDAYDAMTTDRPYRTAMEPDAALEELRNCAGSQFDPRVVEALCASVATGTSIFR